MTIPQSPGRFRSIITFPVDLLMPIPYGIKVVIWKRFEGVLDSVDTLRFTPQETQSLANNTDGGRLGILSIRCNWELEVCS